MAAATPGRGIQHFNTFVGGVSLQISCGPLASLMHLSPGWLDVGVKPILSWAMG